MEYRYSLKDHVLYEKENSDLEFYDEKLFKQPTNNEMVNIFAKHFKKYLRIKLQDQRYFDQWFLLFDLRKKIKKVRDQTRFVSKKYR